MSSMRRLLRCAFCGAAFFFAVAVAGCHGAGLYMPEPAPPGPELEIPGDGAQRPNGRANRIPGGWSAEAREIEGSLGIN